MAKNDQLTKLRQKSRIAALEGLRSQPGFPTPPRKAISLAKKKSKGLDYPLPPYPGTNLLLLFQWARGEWQSLGRWKQLALPVIALVALTTWEKESQLREARYDNIDREQATRLANDLYIQASTKPKPRKSSILPWRR